MDISYRNEVFRKLVHLSSLWMVFAIYFLSQTQAISLFFILLIGMIVFEVSRRHSILCREFVSKHIGHIFRQSEVERNQGRLTGAFFVVLASLVSVVFFSKAIAISSVSIMILADTSAALIGRKYGKIKVLEKTLEGSISFFVVSFCVLSISKHYGLDLEWHEMLLVCLGVTGAELISKHIHIDDNLSIVLAASALTALFTYVF